MDCLSSSKTKVELGWFTGDLGWFTGEGVSGGHLEPSQISFVKPIPPQLSLTILKGSQFSEQEFKSWCEKLN